MDILQKQPVIIKEDGDRHQDRWGSGIWFALLVIFLVVLFISFRREATNPLESLLPLSAAFLNRMPTDSGLTSTKVTDLARDQAQDTGEIVNEVDRTFAQLQNSIALQGASTQKMIADVVANQNRCSFEAERVFNQRSIEELRDRMAEKDRLLIQTEARYLQERTALAISQSNSEINHRISRIEESMLKRPPFIPMGGAPSIDLRVPGPFAPAC